MTKTTLETLDRQYNELLTSYDELVTKYGKASEQNENNTIIINALTEKIRDLEAIVDDGKYETHD